MARTTREGPKVTPIADAATPEQAEPETGLDEGGEGSGNPNIDNIPGDTNFTETANAEQMLQRKRGAGRVGEGFFAKLTAFETHEWERMKIYIYRLAPITDRTAGGNPIKFLTIYQEPVDEYTILKEHGSGKYRLILNGYSEKNECKALGRVEFEIENVNYPPKVPPGEWVEDPRNKRWAWAKEAELKAAAAANAAPVMMQNNAPSLTEVITAVKTLQDMNKPAPANQGLLSGKDIVDLIGKTQTANDPSKILENTKTVLEMMKPAPAAPADNTMLTFVLEELKSTRSENLKLFERMMDKSNAPAPVAAAVTPVDPVAAIKAQAEAYVVLKDAFGAGETAASQSRMNGWQEFLREPVTELISALKPFAGVVAARMMQPAQPQAPAPAAPRVTAAAAQPPLPQTQQPAPNGPEEAPMQDPTMIALSIVIRQADPTLRAFFREQTSGAEFAAEWFCNTEFALRALLPPAFPATMRMMVPESKSGFDLLELLQQTAGKDGQGNEVPAGEWGKQLVLMMYQQHAPTWAEIAPNAEEERRFEKFISDLVGYRPPVEEKKA